MKVQPKKIKLSDYEMDRTLGSGSFGRVKLAKNKKDGNYVAIKILKNEIKILSMIDHPFLVRTDGFNQDKKFLYVVLELVNGGELFTYLRGVGKFPPEQAL